MDQDTENINKVAKAVDELVMNLAVMQKWRKEVANALKQVEGAENRDVWFELLDGIDPRKNNSVLYAILAFCHDDHLRFNPILTNEIRALNCKLCTYPNICIYEISGMDRRLDVHLKYVKEDLLQNGFLKNGTTEFRHSIDYRSVYWFGINYDFTPYQAACVKILWEAWENETPDVGAATLLEESDSYSDRLVDLFKENEAWQQMIVPGQTKGTYRLIRPTAQSKETEKKAAKRGAFKKKPRTKK